MPRVPFAALLLCSCAGAVTRPVDPPLTSDAWSPLTWEERHSEMTFKVHPNMARLFQRHDGKASPDMTCRTCHGPDAAQVAYAMPHGLPALDPSHMPDDRSDEVRFMREEVTPAMAHLLGVDRRVFSCFVCHPRAR